MFKFIRSPENPILLPDEKKDWEAEAAFNGCPVNDGKKVHLVYRAVSSIQEHHGVNMSVSTIGHAVSGDGIHFEKREQFIKPEYDWESFGCEDPRITKLGDKYFIFYTALSGYPFSAENIKIGVAITKDFKKIEKHPVTTFNSKAMALFPKLINKKFAAVLTVHTDLPPAKISIAFFDSEKQMWSADYWKKWHESLDEHVIPLMRDSRDHIEIGAPPVETKDGWLLIYSYIKNYLSSPRVFGIEAVLLDLKNPQKVIARTEGPLLVPEEKYELNGEVPNIVFPSGAILEKNKLYLYYGAADTSCCLAVGNAKDLIENHLVYKNSSEIEEVDDRSNLIKLQRFVGNPIISPRPEFSWENEETFNPAAIELGGKIHIIYRAMSKDGTSVLGYANTKDGFNIDERLNHPIYVPREDFENKKKPGNSGCEDPRITKIGDMVYMLYTAFNGVDAPRVAFTSIKAKDFIEHNWNWEKPVLISMPGVCDKDACLLPKKINDRYVMFHRLDDSICISSINDLIFEPDEWLDHGEHIKPRIDKWDNRKVGIAAPPLETKDGWLLIYHGVSDPGGIYKLGAVLFDLDDKNKVSIKARTDYPIFEPEMRYEKEGVVPKVVFPCGVATIKDNLFVYYGGADKVVGVATAKLSETLRKLKIKKKAD